MSIAPQLAGGRLIIDMKALVANWCDMRDHAAPAQCAAVVKGDGYGCGVEPIVEALVKAECRTFFVALPTEGMRVRAVAPDARIYVLNGVFDGAEPAFLEADLTPVLGSKENIERWVAVARETGKPMPCALHIDSGMNRLGFTAKGFEELINDSEVMSHLDVKLLMTHFACADDVGHPKTTFQREFFDTVTQLLPGVSRSAANTACTWQDKQNIFELARTGTAIYGSESMNDIPNPMRPVVTLEGRVIQVRDVACGETVGYGGTETVKRDTRIAYVSIGYADGYPRAASNTGVAMRGVCGPAQAFYKGRMLSGVGRISMDMCGFDVTDLPRNEIGEGDWIELFGKNLPVDRVANAAGTIGYELLVTAGQRYVREYVW